MSLEWNEDLSIGHPEIDGQHRELFRRFDGFLDACNRRQGRDRLQELFAFLDRYVVEHFRAEEGLMDRHGYPAAEAHRGEHRQFVHKLVDLKRELEKDGPTISVLLRTNKALLYWLSNHIKGVDAGFAAFLKGQSPGAASSHEVAAPDSSSASR